MSESADELRRQLDVLLVELSTYEKASDVPAHLNERRQILELRLFAARPA